MSKPTSSSQPEKFPWFNWFPRDWIAGTATMSPEQKGAFTDLLCYAWEQSPPCTLPDDDETLARLSGLGNRWKKLGAAVRAKFEVVDGRLRNPKQWRVYTDMCEHRERRREAGAVGNARRKALRNAPPIAPTVEPSKEVATTLANDSPPQPQPLPDNGLTEAVSTKPAAAVVENPQAYLQPILRKYGYDSDDTNGSIIKALVKKGVKVDDIEAAVIGLSYMRDNGKLNSFGFAPEDKLSMRILYAASEGKKPIWTDACAEYYRVQPTKKRDMWPKGQIKVVVG